MRYRYRYRYLKTNKTKKTGLQGHLAADSPSPSRRRHVADRIVDSKFVIDLLAFVFCIEKVWGHNEIMIMR